MVFIADVVEENHHWRLPVLPDGLRELGYHGFQYWDLIPIVVADDKLPEFADENLPVPVQE